MAAWSFELESAAHPVSKCHKRHYANAMGGMRGDEIMHAVEQRVRTMLMLRHMEH